MDFIDQKNKFTPNKESLNFAGMNCHYLRYPLNYFLDAMVNFGIHNIELFATVPHFYIDDIDANSVLTLKNDLERRQLHLVCFSPPQAVYPLNIATREEKTRHRSVAFLKKAINTAHQLACPRMLISPGSGYYNEPQAISWEFCRESLCELADYGRTRNVKLMLEPLTPPTTNLINTSALAAQMISEVNSPHLVAIMDLGVMTGMNETVDSYFAALGDKLEYVHFNDGPGAHLALGDGVFPLKQYADDLKRHHYQGYCSFEFNDRKYFTHPDEAMAGSIQWLKQVGLSD
jgi:protein FrlC